MGRLHRWLIAIGAICGLPFGAADLALAQVIQLPTFRFFGMSTTVSVPDRGSAYLGGISRLSTGRRERGVPVLGHLPVAGRPLANRAIARSTGTRDVMVSAYIHDFEAMDEELLERAGALASRSLPASLSPDAAGRVSIAELRVQAAARQATAESQARQDYNRARELLAEGRTGVARLYFERAAKRGGPERRARAAATMRTERSPHPLARTENQPRVAR